MKINCVKNNKHINNMENGSNNSGPPMRGGFRGRGGDDSKQPQYEYFV